MSDTAKALANALRPYPFRTKRIPPPEGQRATLELEPNGHENTQRNPRRLLAGEGRKDR